MGLKGADPSNKVIIPAGRVRAIFMSFFRNAVRIWNQEIDRQILIGKPFAVVFTGGSFGRALVFAASPERKWRRGNSTPRSKAFCSSMFSLGWI